MYPQAVIFHFVFIFNYVKSELSYHKIYHFVQNSDFEAQQKVFFEHNVSCCCMTSYKRDTRQYLPLRLNRLLMKIGSGGRVSWDAIFTILSLKNSYFWLSKYLVFTSPNQSSALLSTNLHFFCLHFLNFFQSSSLHITHKTPNLQTSRKTGTPAPPPNDH